MSEQDELGGLNRTDLETRALVLSVTTAICARLLKKGLFTMEDVAAVNAEIAEAVETNRKILANAPEAGQQ